MPQSSVIAFALLVGFLVFITMRGELGKPGQSPSYRDVIGV